MSIKKLVRSVLAVSMVILAFALWTSGTVAGWTHGDPENAANIRPLSAPGSDDELIYVGFTAAQRSVYEAGWDGVGHVSGVTMGLFLPLALISPPDLTMCVTSLIERGVYCSEPPDTTRNSVQLSCHDSMTCGWVLPTRSNAPLLAVVLDRDDPRIEGPWDLVDAVIILPRGRYALSESEDVALRERADFLLEALSPTRLANPSVFWAPGEALRRPGALQTVSQDEAQSIPLSQGTLTLYPEGGSS